MTRAGVCNMAMLSETKKCIFCGSERQELFSAAPLDYTINRPYVISACVGCGHGITEFAAEDVKY